MRMRWFFLLLDEEKIGPLSLEELVEHVEQRRADADTSYWEEGLEEWEPLGNLMPELREQEVVEEAYVPRAAPALAAPALGAQAVAPSLAAGAAAQQIRLIAHREGVGGRFVFIAWLLTFTAIVMMVFQGGWWGFLVLGVLCAVVAVVMGVAGVTMRRFAGGVLAIFAAVLLPLGTYFYVKGNNLTAFGWTADGQQKVSVTFSEEKYIVDKGKVTYSGIVTNQLSVPITEVAVQVELTNGEGKVVNTGSTLVVANGKLDPGASARVDLEVVGDATVQNRKRKVTFKRVK